MTIKELKEKSYNTAKEKGFWDNYEQLQSKQTEEGDLNAKDIIKNYVITEKLMLITSELGEALEAMRHNKFTKKEELTEAKHLAEKDDSYFNTYFCGYIKDSVEDELADAFIRLADLCEKFNIDIEEHIKLKQRYNDTREKLHGKSF